MATFSANELIMTDYAAIIKNTLVTLQPKMPTINTLEASYRLYLSRLGKQFTRKVEHDGDDHRYRRHAHQQGHRLYSFVVDSHNAPL